MEETRVVIIDDVEEIHNNIRTIFQSRKNDLLDALKQDLFGPSSHNQNLTKERPLIFHSACQGQEGYELVKKSVAMGKPYSVAIVDMRMPPGWDGLQTIRKIREVDQDLEIIVCSAYSDYSWHDIAHELGVNDRYLFLSKPFEVTEMKQMVINLAEKWWLKTKNKMYIEELRKARQTAEASDSAKQEFLSIIGHELRTPLNVILMTLEDLLDSQNDKEALKIIRNSHHSTRYLVRLIEDILLYTEMDKNDYRFAAMPFTLSDVLESCRKQFQTRCDEKKLTLKIKVDQEIPQNFIGDTERIHNVLFQLLSNAVQFTDKGQVSLEVQIDTSFPKHTVLDVLALCFHFTDTGIGMNEDQLAHCFDLFYQGDDPRHHSRTGSGLGLSLCRKIVQALGGTVQIESKQGQGTRAHVTMPLKLDGSTKNQLTA
jgi:signal transduction histidine kinase